MPCDTWDLSSLTRDRICIPCFRRWILNHWTTREIPDHFFDATETSNNLTNHNGCQWIIFIYSGCYNTLLWSRELISNRKLFFTVLQCGKSNTKALETSGSGGSSLTWFIDINSYLLAVCPLGKRKQALCRSLL